MKRLAYALMLVALATAAGCGENPDNPGGPGKKDAVAVESVTVSPESLTLAIGETSVLTAEVLPENATDKSLDWTSDDPAVAVVDNKGNVTAVSAGATAIRATSKDGGLSGECELTVKGNDEPADPTKPVTDPGEPEAAGALPSEGQVEWQKQEMTMFFHFGPTTFSGYDGDKGNYTASQLVSQYKPTGLDCDQWVKTAKDCGFKGVILTVKHHDGFCLWDNPATTCDVAGCAEAYRTDVLKKVAEACEKYGMNLGVYMSPWDKVQTGNYQQNYLSALESIFSGAYGKINEFWLDGHNADKSGINFNTINSTLRGYNPDIVIFSNVGPGCRWVGNEDGSAAETNWSTFSPSKVGATQSSLPGSYGTYLSQGTENGTDWIPAECDLSIRPIGDNNGWFWGSRESANKTAANLMKVYYQSTGRNSIMLLNVPPTSSGVLDANDVKVLQSFATMKETIFANNLATGATAKASAVRGNNATKYGAGNMLDGNYDTYFAAPDGTTKVDIEFQLDGAKSFNRVVLQEYIPLGQRVKSFSIQVRVNGSWTTWGSGTKSTIGYKRIILGSRVSADAVKISITGANGSPILNGFELYNDTVSGL